MLSYIYVCLSRSYSLWICFLGGNKNYRSVTSWWSSRPFAARQAPHRRLTKCFSKWLKHHNFYTLDGDGVTFIISYNKTLLSCGRSSGDFSRWLAGTRALGTTYWRSGLDAVITSVSGTVMPITLTASADADHAGAKDRRSVSGWTRGSNAEWSCRHVSIQETTGDPHIQY
jgi:hypothetical protein